MNSNPCPVHDVDYYIGCPTCPESDGHHGTLQILFKTYPWLKEYVDRLKKERDAALALASIDPEEVLKGEKEIQEGHFIHLDDLASDIALSGVPGGKTFPEDI